MIKDNIIYFGFGDIAVSCNKLSGDITFQQFKPPQDIGGHVDPNTENFEYLSELIVLNFNTRDYMALSNIANSITETKIYNLNDYILDFTNFNQDSVNVVLKYMRFGLQIKECMATNLCYAC